MPSSESMVTFENSECSPTPGADMSSYSSPGSASDHMGASYAHHPQPLYPGSSVLSAFDKKKKQEQATHVNRVITTTKQAESEGSNASLTSINENKTEDPEPVVSASAGSTKKPPERRQKRLERNRESARLSRRRRKHYLEALEARVNQLSSDLDQLRRAHVLQGLPSIVQQRHQLIAQGLLPGEAISRTSPDLMIVNSFQAQQLKSFSIPPSTQFVLWLTLQNDHYFRGGRAASERLSAARIGERVSEHFVFVGVVGILWANIMSDRVLLYIRCCYILADAEQRNNQSCSLAIHVASFMQRNWPFLRSGRKSSHLSAKPSPGFEFVVGSSLRFRHQETGCSDTRCRTSLDAPCRPKRTWHGLDPRPRTALQASFMVEPQSRSHVSLHGKRSAVLQVALGPTSGTIAAISRLGKSLHFG